MDGGQRFHNACSSSLDTLHTKCAKLNMFKLSKRTNDTGHKIGSNRSPESLYKCEHVVTLSKALDIQKLSPIDFFYEFKKSVCVLFAVTCMRDVMYLF